MTDPRIEAAARELNRLFSEGDETNDAMWISCAKCVLDAADAASNSHGAPLSPQPTHWQPLPKPPETP